VDYPATIFSEPAGKAEKGTGQRFNSADGRSTLTIYALENADGDTPASYLRKNLRMPRSAIDYERVTRSFFAISVERQGTVMAQASVKAPVRSRGILPWVMQAASRYRLSKPTTKKQHQKHDQKDSNKPEAAVTVPVPVASESPAQSTG
jgi:hypothetical protein